MRAVAVSSFGGPGVLSVIEVPVPEPGDGQVRVRVQAAPVHPADLAARSGAFAALLPERPYYVLGWDVAGTVDALGAGVRAFAPGDAVIGLSDWLVTQAGTQAEFVVLDASALAPTPSGVSPVEAATLPANAQTAVQALDALGLGEGESLAITGAAGAVGGYAAELARRRGIRVVGIGAERDEEFIAGLGATFVARSDDPAGDPAGTLRAVAPSGVDGLLDAAVVGVPALGAVRDGGVFVSVVPPAAPAAERGIRVSSIGVRSCGSQLRELVALVEGGLLTLRVAQTLPLEEVARAHTMLAEGGVRGRLVLVP